MRKDKVFEYRENLQITTEILEAKFDSIINSQQNVEHLKTEPFQATICQSNWLHLERLLRIA